MNKADEFKYTGTDNLEVMTEAVNYNRYLARLIEKYRFGACNVVDFGAGIGTFAEAVNTAGAEVVAVEPDEDQRMRLSLKNIKAVGDIKDLPDNSIEMVYSINVMEHIEDDVSALRDIYSKLKPGSGVFIYVPAFQIIFSAMDTKVGHYRRYKRADLSAKMQQAGFKIVEARYADSLGFFASFVLKYFGRDDGGLNIAAVKIYDRFIFPLSRALDFFVSRVVGKNLIVYARK